MIFAVKKLKLFFLPRERGGYCLRLTFSREFFRFFVFRIAQNVTVEVIWTGILPILDVIISTYFLSLRGASNVD